VGVKKGEEHIAETKWDVVDKVLGTKGEALKHAGGKGIVVAYLERSVSRGWFCGTGISASMIGPAVSRSSTKKKTGSS